VNAIVRLSRLPVCGVLLSLSVIPRDVYGAPDAAPVSAQQPTPTSQPADPRDEKPAGEAGRRDLSRQRYLEGVAAYEQGRYKDSIDLLLEADSAMHSPVFAYNIGIAYQAMGDSSSALRWLRTYLREVPTAEDRAVVEITIGQLEAKLQNRGVQQVTVLSRPEGAMVLVDGRAVGVSPWTGDLAPGRHVMTLQLRGFRDAEQRIELEPHRARDIEFTLQRAAAPSSVAPSSATPLPEDGSAEPRTAQASIGPWTWITLGAGAGVLGGALAFELMRASAVEDAKKAPQVDYLDALDTAKSRQLTARILTGVGGALVATGIVLLVIDLGSEPAPVQAGIGCTPFGCSVTARGSL
jgi:tetratricopeptide (TPR) repeat protein